MAGMSNLNMRKKVSNKMTLKFDVPMLNQLILYAINEKINKISVGNLATLFSSLNIDAYKYNNEIYDRVRMVQLITEAKEKHNMISPELIQSYIVTTNSELADAVKTFNWKATPVTSAESKYINDYINSHLEYSYLYSVKDTIIDLLEGVDRAEFNTVYEVTNNLRETLSKLLVKMQNTTIGQSLIRQFDFSSGTYAPLITNIVNKSHLPTAILSTGIRQLNAILSPGFQSGRLYTILGLSGKFKSGTLLNIADQLRRFNPQLENDGSGVRKTILFVTMENSIEETIGRLYDMYSEDDDDLSKVTPEHVMEILRENGQYKFDDVNGIDIDLRYFNNLEITTAQLYNVIQEIHDNGKQVIALVLDYLKRINSTFDSKGDERTRLSYASKELKSLAQSFQIPVITAMQMNREGNQIVDSAMRENRADVTRFVGSANIGVCWDVIEESDWVCVVNLEQRTSDGKLYLTFKNVKMRGKKDKTAIDYFNHPFTNSKNIRLMTDIDKPASVSIISLQSDLKGVDTSKLESAAQVRPKINVNKAGRELLQNIGISVDNTAA